MPSPPKEVVAKEEGVSQDAWVLSLTCCVKTLPLTCCVKLDKLLGLSTPGCSQSFLPSFQGGL